MARSRWVSLASATAAGEASAVRAVPGLRFGRQGFIANGQPGRRPPLGGRRPADARPNARTVTVLQFVIGPKSATLARLMLVGAQSIQPREHTAIMAVRIAWTIVALIIVGAAGVGGVSRGHGARSHPRAARHRQRGVPEGRRRMGAGRERAQGLQARLSGRQRFHRCFTRFTRISPPRCTMVAVITTASSRSHVRPHRARRLAAEGPHSSLGQQERGAADPGGHLAHAPAGAPGAACPRSPTPSACSSCFKRWAAAVQVDFASGVLEIEHRDSAFDARGVRLPQAMRSSILLVPPLLARFGQARIEDEVRGCTLGVREIDPHVEVFERFGARIERSDDGWLLHAQRPLAGHLALARLRLGHHHRELRAVRRAGRRAARRSSMPPASRTCRSSAAS